MVRLREKSITFGVLQRQIPKDNGYIDHKEFQYCFIKDNGGITQQLQVRNVFNSECSFQERIPQKYENFTRTWTHNSTSFE